MQEESAQTRMVTEAMACRGCRTGLVSNPAPTLLAHNVLPTAKRQCARPLVCHQTAVVASSREEFLSSVARWFVQDRRSVQTMRPPHPTPAPSAGDEPAWCKRNTRNNQRQDAQRETTRRKTTGLPPDRGVRQAPENVPRAQRLQQLMTRDGART